MGVLLITSRFSGSQFQRDLAKELSRLGAYVITPKISLRNDNVTVVRVGDAILGSRFDAVIVDIGPSDLRDSYAMDWLAEATTLHGSQPNTPVFVL